MTTKQFFKSLLSKIVNALFVFHSIKRNIRNIKRLQVLNKLNVYFPDNEFVALSRSDFENLWAGINNLQHWIENSWDVRFPYSFLAKGIKCQFDGTRWSIVKDGTFKRNIGSAIELGWRSSQMVDLKGRILTLLEECLMLEQLMYSGKFPGNVNRAFVIYENTVNSLANEYISICSRLRSDRK